MSSLKWGEGIDDELSQCFILRHLAGNSSRHRGLSQSSAQHYFGNVARCTIGHTGKWKTCSALAKY
jgi:hypothetical protein